MKQNIMTKKHSLPALVILLFFLIGSCGQPPHRQATTRQSKTPINKQSFVTGKVYKKVNCRNQPDFSYALYLPKTADSNNAHPVVFFFDAHARGWLPVTRYQHIADSLGYILAASNDSQNGQTSHQRNTIIYAFMADVEQRFHIDTNRIYTSGFSGGARIAAGIGLFNKGIAGVIGCAAGNPQTLQKGRNNYPVVDLVGNKDFNFIEMLALENKMSSAHQTHQLLVFDGKHEWPPEKEMFQAFLFMETDAMRRKLCPINKPLLEKLKKNLDAERQTIDDVHKPFNRYKADKKLIAFLDDLVPVNSYRKEMTQLSRRPLFQKQRIFFQNLMLREQKSQQQLASALGSKDIYWWNNEISQLYKGNKSARSNEEKRMNQRLLNYLSLMSYLYANANLNHGNPQGANKFLSIYEQVDPTNPEVYFLKAQQKLMLKAPEKEAIELLEKSVKLGFDDPGRIKDLAELYKLSNLDHVIEQATTNRQKTSGF